MNTILRWAWCIVGSVESQVNRLTQYHFKVSSIIFHLSFSVRLFCLVSFCFAPQFSFNSMASSSQTQTASSSSHHSSAPRWKYDVFLSFRGEDTRRTIVSTLYHELRSRDIDTFMDDTGLTRGTSISPSLLTAIQESRSAIVVLSPNYAYSQWCLDELTMIIQCMKYKGTTVIPIFYDVHPSDVRHQKGSFAKAFSRYQEKFEEDDNLPFKLNEWRVALTTVAGLSGLESNKYR